MKILMISNMYPDKNNPHYGIFVKSFYTMLTEYNCEVDKVILKKCNNKFLKLINYIFYYLNVIKRILFNKYDLIYVHYGSHNSIPLLISYLFKKFKCYVNLHGSDVEATDIVNSIFQPFQKSLLIKCNKIVVPSNTFKELVRKKYNIEEDKIAVFPSGGIDNEIFYPSETNIFNYQDMHFSKKENKYIGFVGRLDQNKGWQTFIEAINILINEKGINDIIFIFVGKGKEINKFKKMVQGYKLEKNIIHLPFLDHSKLKELYNFIDILVFPTLRESLGLVGLESLACGTPVIASDLPVLKEYIFHGENGFIFSKGNEEDLAEKIIKYIECNECIKKEMSNMAIEVSKRYNIDQIKVLLKKIIFDE